MLGSLLALVHLLIWLWALTRILGSGAGSGQKALWIIVVFLLPVVGLVAWYLVGPGSPKD
jgi:hypothetical protein